jgi:hypothetical protein
LLMVADGVVWCVRAAAVSTHSDSHVVSGCYNNLFLLFTSNRDFSPVRGARCQCSRLRNCFD